MNIQKITAVWAFTESVFGGVLHILKIPFTGLFIGSFAVTCIFLIAHYGKKPSLILRSTIIVLLVKAVVSPYTPITAYLAVSVQGLLGYLVFLTIKNEGLASSLLGISALLLSALQKVIILTLLFGTNLWKSVDTFYIYLIDKIGLTNSVFTQSISLFFISIYVGIHLLAGLFVGYKAVSIPKWIELKSHLFSDYKNSVIKNSNLFEDEKSNTKRKRWWQKKSGFALFSFLFLAMITSYFIPQFELQDTLDILIMIIRSIAITLFWFYFAAPHITKIIRKIVERKKSDYGIEIDNVISLFPEIKMILNYAWQITSDKKGWFRIKSFLGKSITLLLLYELVSD